MCVCNLASGASRQCTVEQQKRETRVPSHLPWHALRYVRIAPAIPVCILALLFRFLPRPLVPYPSMGPNFVIVIVQAGVAYRLSGWSQGQLTLHACLSAAHMLARSICFMLPGTGCGFQLWALSVQGFRYAMDIVILVVSLLGCGVGVMLCRSFVGLHVLGFGCAVSCYMLWLAGCEFQRQLQSKTLIKRLATTGCRFHRHVLHFSFLCGECVLRHGWVAAGDNQPFRKPGSQANQNLACTVLFIRRLVQ